ncbi:MAG: shikimate kinase [Betaproteobacteria bacterium]|nr:shikimate kinase [Betaproteobacteria bacterium]MDH4293297.1 shikimate kinase [Betaproteobacteria bacterium]MDH5342091.1 shikimate kinase [Betaproteobacteria bacterium]
MSPNENSGIAHVSRDNIFLVGLMGAGKTSVGRMLAKRMGTDFYDTDVEVESATGVKIPVIFDIEGESGFRAREEKMIEKLTAMHGIVLATGGGAVLSPANRDRLKQHGLVIYLRAAPEDLWRRTRRDRNRPLLQTPNPLEKLKELHAQRDPLYAEVADLIVDTGAQSVGNLTSQIQKLLADTARQAKHASA